MFWQIFVIGFLAFATISYLMRRISAVEFPDYYRLSNSLFYVFGLIPIILVVAFFSHPNLNIGLNNLIFLVLGSFAFPLASVMIYSASREIDIGFITILSNLTPTITIAIAWISLHEKLSAIQLLGTVIIIFSSVIISFPLLEQRRKSKNPALVLAVAGIILVGAAAVFERYMLKRIDFGAYLLFGWGMQSIYGALLGLGSFGQLAILKNKRFLKVNLIYIISNSLKAICFVAALKLSGNVSMVAALTSFLPILVVISAYAFLKEKDHLSLKVTSAVIGIVGIVLINQ